MTAGGEGSEAGTNLCPQDLAHVKLGIIEIFIPPHPYQSARF